MNKIEHTREAKTKPQEGQKYFASLKMHVSQTDWLKLLFLSFWSIIKWKGIILFCYKEDCHQKAPWIQPSHPWRCTSHQCVLATPRQYKLSKNNEFLTLVLDTWQHLCCHNSALILYAVLIRWNYSVCTKPFHLTSLFYWVDSSDCLCL